MEARQLAAHIVNERRLIRLHARQRQRDDQIRDVVRAVLRDREQQQRQAAARVVVETAEQPEVEQREPAVVGEEHVARVRIRVVDALDDDLVHVRAEELARELLRDLGSETVIRRGLASLDVLEREHALGDVRTNHARDDEQLVVLDEPRDQLGVVRLFEEVELGAEVNLELVGERLDLQELRGLGVAGDQRGGRAQQREVELDLLDDPRPPDLHHDLRGRSSAARDASARSMPSRAARDRCS